MKRIVRKRMMEVLFVVSAILLCACGKKEKTASKNEIVLKLENTVEGQISILIGDWEYNGESLGNRGIELAGGKEKLSAGTFAFSLPKEKFPADRKDGKYAVAFLVTDAH